MLNVKMYVLPLKKIQPVRLTEGLCRDQYQPLKNKIFFVYMVVIYKYPLPCGLQIINTASSLSFAIFSWFTACISSSPPRIIYMCASICQGLSSYLSYHLRTASNLYSSSLFLSNSLSIQVNPPFLFPTSFLFTHTYPLFSRPPSLSPHPSPFLSLSPALCVLLRRSNFPFDFGGNAFFTNQRGSQAAPPPPPHLPPFLPPPLLSLPPSLLQSLFLAPLGPPGQRGDKGAPIISLLVLIWAAQGFQVPPITPRNIITSSPGNTVPHTHTLTHTCMHRLSDTDTHRL